MVASIVGNHVETVSITAKHIECIYIYRNLHAYIHIYIYILKPTNSMSQHVPGNSFASTTAQVNLIASLVNATGWNTLTKNDFKMNLHVDNAHKKRIHEGTCSDQQIKKRKLCGSNVDPSSTSKKRSSDNVCSPPIVMKRCRGKQPDPAKSSEWFDRIVKRNVESKRGRGRPKGSTKSDSIKADRSGKSSSLTIQKKMNIIDEYERLCSLGTIKHVEKFMLQNGKLRGGYQGCLSKSKWLGAREKYKWDDFIKFCPKLANQVHEVPNALLDVLGTNVS